MPFAVCNSSPLIHLSLIGHISLFRRFSEVLIPPAVWWEVVEQDGDRPGITEIRDARESWLRVIEPSNRALVRLLEQELHAGLGLGESSKDVEEKCFQSSWLSAPPGSWHLYLQSFSNLPPMVTLKN